MRGLRSLHGRRLDLEAVRLNDGVRFRAPPPACNTDSDCIGRRDVTTADLSPL